MSQYRGSRESTRCSDGRRSQRARWTHLTSCPTICVGQQKAFTNSSYLRVAMLRSRLAAATAGSVATAFVAQHSHGLLPCTDWLTADLFMCTRKLVVHFSSCALVNPMTAIRFSSTSDFVFCVSMSATFCTCDSRFRVEFCSLSDATPVDNSQCCTCVCSEHEVACDAHVRGTAPDSHGLSPTLAHGARLHLTRRQCLQTLRGAPMTTPPLVDTTPPDVLILLDLQPVQSESVCTAKWVSNASNLHYCLIPWFSRSFKHFAILTIVHWSFFVGFDMASDISGLQCSRSCLWLRLLGATLSLRAHSTQLHQV